MISGVFVLLLKTSIFIPNAVTLWNDLLKATNNIFVLSFLSRVFVFSPVTFPEEEQKNNNNKRWGERHPQTRRVDMTGFVIFFQREGSLFIWCLSMNTRASRDWITANKSPPSSLKTDNDDDAEINHYVLYRIKRGGTGKKNHFCQRLPFNVPWMRRRVYKRITQPAVAMVDNGALLIYVLFWKHRPFVYAIWRVSFCQSTRARAGSRHYLSAF